MAFEASILVVFFVGVALTLMRLIRGPAGVDRVMSIDFLTTQLMVFLLFFAWWKEATWALDIVLVLSVISFFGTLMYALYLEKPPKV
ncbi:MAG: monovalent cation/H+ antiporter complex subunit F [Bdellovibrionaceae bacterium]|jgi:multisubunit Na+/H+ antiporter MnhF subunit|nr:monovalent cation/H+ antiporter complex subunit F [Pseudobdellovibrionaceae bacterium]